MTWQFLYNPSDSPVVLDDEGRTLGGREWGWGDHRHAGPLLDSGVLVKADKPGADANREASAAYDSKPTRRGASSDSEKE